MKRTHYNNGDEVSLHTGCDSCSPSIVQGVFCHETGCPDAWRDRLIECKECGCDFYPYERYQVLCEGCTNPEPTPEYGYAWEGYGLTIYGPAGSCFLQGEEASELHDQLEACEDERQIDNLLSAYDDVCE